MGEVWFNVETGEVFEQTLFNRMTKKKLREGKWVYLFTKDHRYSPHGWAVKYAWCDRCQQYHYVYDSYNGSISNQDLRYIDLLDRTHDCKIAKLVYDLSIHRDSKYEHLLKLLEIFEITGDEVDEYKWAFQRFMWLPARKRRRLLKKSKDEILAYLVASAL